MLYFLQEKMIFLPRPLAADHEYSFSERFEEFDLKAPDGGLLNALYFPVENAKGLILYYHGNAGNLDRWGKIVSYFPPQGYAVIVMDYRGYGKSQGKRNEQTLRQDALLFYQHARDLGFKEEEIIVYGRSLGASIATYVASQKQPSQLVLETPFYNLTDVAQHRFPFLPVQKLLKYRFPSDQFIKSVDCPVTIFHGTEDQVVPIDSGKKLYDAIGDNPARFYTIEGGKHNNLIEFDSFREGLAETLEGKGISQYLY
jgi:alpha-beta hydrolase superfamily lysophospholipase